MRVCLPVAVGHGGCWLAAAVAVVVGVILYRYHFGDLKSTKNDKIHKIHAPKIQGRVFSEVAEAPQAAPTPRTLVGDLKPVTNVHFESTFSTFFKNVDFSKCQN